jgi:hypothetical protein
VYHVLSDVCITEMACPNPTRETGLYMCLSCVMLPNAGKYIAIGNSPVYEVPSKRLKRLTTSKGNSKLDYVRGPNANDRRNSIYISLCLVKGTNYETSPYVIFCILLILFPFLGRNVSLGTMFLTALNLRDKLDWALTEETPKYTTI